MSWIWVPRGFCPTNWDQDFMKVGILEKNSPSFFWHRQESVRITRVGIYGLCCLPSMVGQKCCSGKQPDLSCRIWRGGEKITTLRKITRTGKTRNFMFVKNWKKNCLIEKSMLIQHRVLLNDTTCWSTVLCFTSVLVFFKHFTPQEIRVSFLLFPCKRFQLEEDPFPGNPIFGEDFFARAGQRWYTYIIYTYVHI